MNGIGFVAPSIPDVLHLHGIDGHGFGVMGIHFGRQVEKMCPPANGVHMKGVEIVQEVVLREERVYKSLCCASTKQRRLRSLAVSEMREQTKTCVVYWCRQNVL